MRRLAPILLVALSSAALAQQDVFDQLLERYIRPQAAAGGDVLHLFYLRKSNPQEMPQSRHRRYTLEKGWSEKEERFNGAHLSVAVLDDTRIIFRSKTYSAYWPGDWGTWRWPADWAPSAACVMRQAAWAFGVEAAEEAHRLRVARLGIDETGECKEPQELAAALELPAAAADLDVAVLGDAARVFWHQAETGGNSVWMAGFDGTAWTQPVQVEVPQTNSDFVVAAHDGAVWLFSRERGKRVTQKRPLMAMALEAGRWSAPSIVPEARDAWFEFTFDMEAVSFKGTLYLFRGCMSHVALHRWRDGAWTEPERLFEASPWAMYLTWWYLANGAACLCLLPVVVLAAFRGSRHPRQVSLRSGATVTTATWGRRVMALVIDFCMVEGIYNAGLVLLGVSYSGTMEDLPAGVLGHVVVFFVYFLACESLTGQSLGKWGLNIIVVNEHGRRASFGQALIRSLLRPWLLILPVAYLVGSILVLLTPRSQRLGDLLAGTVVVEIPRRPREPAESDEA